MSVMIARITTSAISGDSAGSRAELKRLYKDMQTFPCDARKDFRGQLTLAMQRNDLFRRAARADAHS
jgi:hypothetical protein